MAFSLAIQYIKIASSLDPASKKKKKRHCLIQAKNKNFSVNWF